MAISKVVYGAKTLVDLTGDTVTPDDVAEGVTFHGADGVKRSGTRSSAPAAHASTHATGGSDPITPANIGAASSSHTHTPASIGAADSEHSHGDITSDGKYATPIAGEIALLWCYPDGSIFPMANAETVNALDIATASFVGENIAELYQYIDGLKPVATTVTLYSGSWEKSAQSVSVTGVTASKNIIVSPHPDYFTEYVSANIRAVNQSANTVDFECDTTPTANIQVNILIVG